LAWNRMESDNNKHLIVKIFISQGRFSSVFTNTEESKIGLAYCEAVLVMPFDWRATQWTRRRPHSQRYSITAVQCVVCLVRCLPTSLSTTKESADRSSVILWIESSPSNTNGCSHPIYHAYSISVEDRTGAQCIRQFR
jgi:hypothetical protein